MKLRSNNTEYSRPFDVHKWSDFPQVKKLAGKLYNDIVDSGFYKPGDHSANRRLKRTIRIVLIDLYAAWQEDPDLYIGYSRTNSHYSKQTRYDNIHIKKVAMLMTVDYLHKHHYIEHTIGSKHPDAKEGRVSRMRASDELIKLFSNYKIRKHHVQASKDKPLIVKKDENKNLVDFKDNRKTNKMRKNVERINEHLKQFDINLHITDEQEAAMVKQLREKQIKHGEVGKNFTFTETTLYRVFNNNSFEEGGRFYGGWWQQVPKKYRKHITIDGMPTVEMDYSTMHMTILYAQNGLVIEGDAYTLDGYTGEDVANDDYAVKLRKQVKKLTNAMLNSKDGNIDSSKFNDQPWPHGKTIKNVQNDILKKHKAIAEHFNSGIGTHLQYQDSIVAERVMLKVIEKLHAGFLHKAVVLPVHDSFIIPKSLLNTHSELMDIMKEEFLEVTGYDINVDVKDGVKEELGPMKQFEKAYKEEHGLNMLPNALDKESECGKAYAEQYSNYLKRKREFIEAVSDTSEEPSTKVKTVKNKFEEYYQKYLSMINKNMNSSSYKNSQKLEN